MFSLKKALAAIMGQKPDQQVFQIDSEFLKGCVAGFPIPEETPFDFQNPMARRWELASTLVNRTVTMTPSDYQNFRLLADAMYLIATNIEEQGNAEKIAVKKKVVGELFFYSSMFMECISYYREESRDNVVSLATAKIQRQDQSFADLSQTLGIAFVESSVPKLLDTETSRAFEALYKSVKAYSGMHPEIRRDPLSAPETIVQEQLKA